MSQVQIKSDVLKRAILRRTTLTKFSKKLKKSKSYCSSVLAKGEMPEEVAINASVYLGIPLRDFVITENEQLSLNLGGANIVIDCDRNIKNIEIDGQKMLRLIKDKYKTYAKCAAKCNCDPTNFFHISKSCRISRTMADLLETKAGIPLKDYQKEKIYEAEKPQDHDRILDALMDTNYLLSELCSHLGIKIDSSKLGSQRN